MWGNFVTWGEFLHITNVGKSVKWKISPHEKGGENLSHGEISPHEKCGDKSVKWKMSPHEKGGENLSRGEISPHERCAENMSSGKILHMINVEKNLSWSLNVKKVLHV